MFKHPIKNRRIFISVNTLIIIFLVAFTVSAQITDNTQATKTDSNYRIGVGDVISVLIPKNALLTTDSVRVNNDGTIRLPMIDDAIPAKCLTEVELTAEVTKKYKKYLINPQVYLTVKEFKSNPVAVVGAVNTPGRFQLQRPIRLLELITYVNGIGSNAGRNLQIIRNPDSQSCSANPEEPLEEEIINLPIAQIMKGIDEANPYIYAGDIIQVADAEQAFIIGNVRAARTITLNEPITLSKAIAMAGGVSSGAQTKKIKISRQEVDSLTKTELIVNLKDINDQKAEDILLQPNDIVDVPGPSGTKKFFKDIFRSVVPIFTRMPVVIP